jgi:hypothetical protein
MPTVDCPSCGRKLRVAEELLGATVQCPACATTFTGPGALPEPAVPPVLPSDPPEEPPTADEGPPVHGLPPPPRPLRPVLLSSSIEPGPPPDRKRPCPVCGNREEYDAVRCSVCNSALQGERPPSREPELPPRRDYEPDRGTMISTMATVSILFSLPGLCGAAYAPFTIASGVATILGITCLVMSYADLAQMDKNIMDPQGRDSTRSGQAQAWIGTVIGGVGLLLSAVHMLVIFAD